MKKYLILLINLIFGFTILAQTSKEDFLILNYQFGDDSGSTTIKDSSPLGNDGILKGSGGVVSDGVLSLPGGASGASAAYVQLPTGMFDGQDTLSISIWLKNKTGSGNYAAMFFGTTEKYPVSYWLLNPANPSGLFKSVVTNSVSSSSPWNTEYGFSPAKSSQGMQGPSTDDEWNLFTTIITPNYISTYYNGEYVGKVSLRRKVSDFGSDLVGYIGRSSYSDKFYNGDVKRVKVYNTVLSQYDVLSEYYAALGSEVTKAHLLADSAALSFCGYDVVEDVDLPQYADGGSSIVWASSNIACMDEKGRVNRDDSGNKNVVMTATLSLGGQSLTKAFLFNVCANTTEGDLQYYIGTIDLGISYVTSDIALPTSVGGYSITWSSSNDACLDNEGKVTRPSVGSGDQKVTLIATIKAEGYTYSKKFVLTVAEADYGYLMSYILFSNSSSENDLERARSYYAAYSSDASTYTVMNNEKALVYPLLGTKKMRFPTLFRKPDGTFGLIATDNATDGFIVFHSDDLITYEDETYLQLDDEVNVKTFVCEYNNSKLAYVIKWEESNGKYYESLTKDFTNIDSTKQISSFSRPTVSGTAPSGATDCSVLALTKAEYEKVVKKYAKITNTGIERIAPVQVSINSDIVMPDRVTATYSDGSTKDLGVEWDTVALKAIDITKAGTYTITGEVQQSTYSSPLIEQRADPCITKGDDGYYYFTASYPMDGSGDSEGYDRVILRRATTIEGLATADEITIWDEKNTNSAFRYVWAPEIHQINGEWYVFFTTSVSRSSVWGIRPRVICCNKGEKDPYNPDCWEVEGHLMQALDDVSFTAFSLDMTHFEANGTHYVAWAQAVGHSSVLIASVEADKPWVTTSKYTLLTGPEYAWEWEGDWVNEGPAVIKNNGKVYLAYSASSVNDTYCVGMMSADENADLLDANSWTKSRYPLLSTEDLPVEQNGPGHNSFTVDEFGNPVIVYHARNPEETTDGGLYDPGRHANVKGVNFAADGMPVLNMTEKQELDDAYKSVSVMVEVK